MADTKFGRFGSPKFQDDRIYDPQDFTGKFDTTIPPEKKAAFSEWVKAQTKSTGKSPLNDQYDYDVNGYFLSGQGADGRGHMTDQFKKPNHPTFSDESQWNGVEGHGGGAWGADSYTPSGTNLEMAGSSEALKDYLKRADPQVKLMPQEPVPAATGKNGKYRISDLTKKVAR